MLTGIRHAHGIREGGCRSRAGEGHGGWEEVEEEADAKVQDNDVPVMVEEEDAEEGAENDDC